MTSRRDFLATTGLAASALALAARRADAAGTASPILTANTEPDPQVKVLLLEALNAARIAGAGWADARIQRQRRQNLGTREQQVTNVSDTDTIGCTTSGPRVAVSVRSSLIAVQLMVTQLRTTSCEIMEPSEFA